MLFHGTQALSDSQPYRAADGAGGTHIPFWVLHRKVQLSPMDRLKMPELKLGMNLGLQAGTKQQEVLPTQNLSWKTSLLHANSHCHGFVTSPDHCSRPAMLLEVWRKCPVSQQWTKEITLLDNFTVIFCMSCLPFCLPSPTQPFYN